MIEEGVDLFQGWSKEEIQVFQKILAETTKGREVLESKQIREIIPIEAWLESEYYVGKDGKRLYPFWKQEMIDIFGTNRGKYNEVILTGAIGTGKSTMALFCMLRKLYELSCYENVRGLFDLMSSSKIMFLYFSVNREQAELTGFGQFRDLIDSIPYFRKEFTRNMDLGSALVFPESILFLHGSTSRHAIGMNMIGAILDEANFFQGEATDGAKAASREYSTVADLYATLINRAMSRFTAKGKSNELAILVSSATHSSSFTEQRIKASLNSPSTKVISARLWDVKPEGTYSKNKFYVFTGSDLLDPYLVDSDADINRYLDSVSESKRWGEVGDIVRELPPHHREKFVAVPEDFRKGFEIDLIRSLQDIAGVAVAPLGKLFTSRPTYIRCCDIDDGHPFTKDEIEISTASDLTLDKFLKRGWRFKDPSIPRYVHIDQSLTNDCTGFSMVHIAEKLADDRGIVKPKIKVDFALRITPPKSPAKISISRVRNFLYYMKDVLGITYAKVTYDIFASQEAQQELLANGINSGHLSVDRTDDAYLAFTNLLYESRISMYYYKPVDEELFDLIHDRTRRRVDHPVKGKKDVMDSLVGACFNALSIEKGDISYTSALKDFGVGILFDYDKDDEMAFTFDELMR